MNNYVTKENINKNNPNWPQILDHPYTILIIGGSGSRKKNLSLNLMENKMMVIIVLSVKLIYIKVPNKAKLSIS